MKKLLPLSLRLLRVFEAVARNNSVGRAASEIHVSQPGVTQALNRIERQIGAVLFTRDRSGAYLTSYGELLLSRVRRLLAQIGYALSKPMVGAPFGDAGAVKSMQLRITSTHIRSIIAVAESGSFEGAARMLGVSQPALYRAARDLEKVLQRSIYERNARGLTTTRQAAELARRLNIACRELDYAIDEIRAAQGIVTSRIVVGNIPHSDIRLLATGINDLLTRHPNAHLQVIDGHYDQLLDGLRAGRIDILFGVLRRPNWAVDVQEEFLFSNPYSVVVRKDHPVTHLSRITRRQLAKYNWIMPATGAPRRNAFEILFDGMTLGPAVSVETSSIAVCRALLAASNRITLMSHHEAQSESALGGLSPVRFRSPALKRVDGFAVRKDWHPTKIHQQFMTLLRQRATEKFGSP